MVSEEKLLSTAEVGERVGVDEQTVRLWIKKGKLEALKVGRGWRIPRSALEAFLENAPKAVAPPSPKPEVSEERRVEESEPDALAETIGRVSAWGREVAGSDAGSAELLRDLKFIDDVFEGAFRDYREREARGEEAGGLARSLEGLVVASVVVKEALEAAAREEADPGKKAQIADFMEHHDRRGTARALGLRQAEAG